MAGGKCRNQLAIVAKGQVTVEAANEGKTIASAGAGWDSKPHSFAERDIRIPSWRAQIAKSGRYRKMSYRPRIRGCTRNLLRAALQAVGARFPDSLGDDWNLSVAATFGGRASRRGRIAMWTAIRLSCR